MTKLVPLITFNSVILIHRVSIVIFSCQPWMLPFCFHKLWVGEHGLNSEGNFGMGFCSISELVKSTFTLTVAIVTAKECLSEQPQSFNYKLFNMLGYHVNTTH